MKKYRKFEIPEQTDINISPLIDLIFLLLIFFIVTTAFVEEVGVNIERPEASMSENLEKKSIMLGITRKGAVIYGEREIGVNSIRGLIARLLKEENRPVILIADDRSETGVMIEVLDECKAAGASQVNVATRRKEN